MQCILKQNIVTISFYIVNLLTMLLTKYTIHFHLWRHQWVNLPITHVQSNVKSLSYHYNTLNPLIDFSHILLFFHLWTYVSVLKNCCHIKQNMKPRLSSLKNNHINVMLSLTIRDHATFMLRKNRPRFQI